MVFAGVDDADAFSAVGTLRAGVPRLPRRLLERPALEAVLDDPAPLTIVNGVQGYGKTTLLAAWARRRQAGGLPTSWIAAHPELNSLVAFRGAMDRAMAGFDHGARSVVVIDDLHEIEDEDILSWLLDLIRLDPGVRLVVSTRRRHRIEAIAAGDLEVKSIPAHDLTLSVREILALARLMGRELDTSDAERLRAAVGGWMAPVRIVLEASRPDEPLPITAVRDYLFEKVLPSVRDEEILRLLKWYSVAARLDVAMVRDLAGATEARRVLAMLEAPGLIERHYRDDRIELVLPTLIKDILRGTFEQDEPDAARDAHRAFAGRFSRGTDADSYISAFEHAVRAEDWELATRVWAEHATLLSMSYPGRFRDALSLVPESVTAHEPGMRVAWLAIGVVAHETRIEADTTAAWLRAYGDASARALAEARGASSLRDLLHFAAGRLAGLRTSGRFVEAVTFAGEAGALVAQRLAAGEYPGDRLCWFYLQAGISYRTVGDEVQAVRAYTLAWEYAARSQVPVIEANAAASLALIYTYKLDRRRARLWLGRKGSIDTRHQWSSHLVEIPGILAGALQKLDDLDSDGTRAELRRVEDATASLDAWQVIAYVHAQHALYFGDPAAALTELDDALRAHQPQPAGQEVAFSILTRSAVDLLIAAGRRRDAEAILGAQPDNPLLSVPVARISSLAGDYQGARSIVRESVWQSRRRPRDRIELLVIDALAAMHLGDRDGASTSLRRAIDAARASGYLRGLAAIPLAELDALLTFSDLAVTADERIRLAGSRRADPHSPAPVALTDRERALLDALDAGTPRQQIASALFVSVNTVNTQMRGLYRKLGVRSRDEALAAARRLDVL